MTKIALKRLENTHTYFCIFTLNKKIRILLIATRLTFAQPEQKREANAPILRSKIERRRTIKNKNDKH